MNNNTVADDLRGISMGYVWGGVVVVVSLIAGVPLLEVLLNLVSNQGGAGGEDFAFLFIKALETFALTAGVAILAYLIITGKLRDKNSNSLMLTGAAILFGTGVLGILLRAVTGVGVLPDYNGWQNSGGGGAFRLLGIVIGAYLSTYSLGQMITSLAIGSALALQVERSTNKEASITSGV